MESLGRLLKPQQSEPDHPEEQIHAHTYIAIRHKGELTYEDFVSEFMIPNRPVIIQVGYCLVELLHGDVDWSLRMLCCVFSCSLQ